MGGMRNQPVAMGVYYLWLVKQEEYYEDGYKQSGLFLEFSSIQEYLALSVIDPKMMKQNSRNAILNASLLSKIH